MEKFINLPIEKQTTIINAALKSFGTNGYKKASISDIAKEAGISKAMVFHYFGTKKELYLYLLRFCADLVMNDIMKKLDSSITDFFDRIKWATTLKVDVIRKHPATLSYLNSVYYETDEEVREGINSIMFEGDIFRQKVAFEGMDYSKFKKEVDVKLVMKMVVWISEGFINPVRSMKEEDLDRVCKDFFDSLVLLRKNLYREECL